MKRLPVLFLFVALALAACVQQQSPPEVDPGILTTQAAEGLVIHEIMQNPASVSDSVGEWFEIFNPGATAVDINGWTIADNDFDSHVISTVFPLLVPAGGYLVLGNNGDTSVNGGANVGYVYFDVALANGADELVLFDASLSEVDRVEWDGGPSFPDPSGASMALIDPTLNNNVGSNWCTSSTTFGTGDLGTPGAANDCPVLTPSAVINEFVANHTGSDTNEYVEISGDPDSDYSSLTILEIEGDGTGAGVIDGVIPVGTTNADGYWSTGFLSNELENGSITLLLVAGFTGTAGTDLDTDNDGALDITPWTSIVDSVAVTDGDSGDLTYGLPVLAPGFDGSPFTPGGASRIPDSVDTDAVSDWTLNDFDLFGVSGFAGSPVVGEAVNTPGEANRLVGDLTAIGVCGDPATLISAIQGSDFASPLAGELVVIEGVVVGDFQDDDGDLFDTDLDGFYVQEEDADADGDTSTSEGIFVFAPDAADVSVGETVRVRGSVEEFFELTEITNVTDVLVCGSGSTPAATPLTLPLTNEQREAVEGMLVTFEQDLVISEYFNFDRFGEIVLALPNPSSEDRQYQPTSFVEPGAAAAEELAENDLRRITLDDGRGGQNLDPARHPDGNVFDLSNRFRGGDVVTDATGVMDFRFGLYKIQPTTGATYTSVNPRPGSHASVGGTLKVATFNVLNYFLTLDSRTPICGPLQNLECRGADDSTEFTRQRTKILAALSEIDADVFGLIEMENTPGVEPLADLVAGLNDISGAGTYDFIDTGVIGTDAIKVGFIYKTGSVTPVGNYAVLDSSVDPRFIDTKNRPVLAQTFATSDGAVFTAAVNHLKSKGSSCDDVGDPNLEDGQGNCNLTREAAAEALVDWLASDPTGSGDADFLILGDLNSYDEEDPIQVLLDANYTDLGEKYEGEFAYTYVFDGQFGHLDYSLSNSNLTPQVTGATNWHINADEADILDYDTSFKQPAQAALYEPNAYRSSDHDPVIVGLDLNASPVCTNARPSKASLWPPNHMMQTIQIRGVTDAENDTISINIDSIFQDEPVDLGGDSDGNTSPDGAGIDTSTAQVRAERIEGGNGRVYTIDFTATDSAGGSCSGTVLVGVPSSQGRNGAAVDDGALFNSTETP